MMRRAFPLLGVLAALPCMLLSNSAVALCREPIFSESQPRPPGQYQRPERPECLTRGNADACEARELREYENDSESYLFRLQQYVETARRFSEAANELAAQAEAYARCEAEELGAATGRASPPDRQGRAVPHAAGERGA